MLRPKLATKQKLDSTQRRFQQIRRVSFVIIIKKRNLLKFNNITEISSYITS